MHNYYRKIRSHFSPDNKTNIDIVRWRLRDTIGASNESTRAEDASSPSERTVH